VETRVAALLELIDEALQVSEQRLLDESDAVMIERVSNVVPVLQKTALVTCVIFRSMVSRTRLGVRPSIAAV